MTMFDAHTRSWSIIIVNKTLAYRGFYYFLISLPDTRTSISDHQSSILKHPLPAKKC